MVTTPEVVEGAARALYDHEMDTYEPTSDNREAFWLDPDVRAFWLDRAHVVINHLAVHGAQGLIATQEVTS